MSIVRCKSEDCLTGLRADDDNFEDFHSVMTHFSSESLMSVADIKISVSSCVPMNKSEKMKSACGICLENFVTPQVQCSGESISEYQDLNTNKAQDRDHIPQLLSCAHIFGKTCLLELANNLNTSVIRCPCCRKETDISDAIDVEQSFSINSTCATCGSSKLHHVCFDCAIEPRFLCSDCSGIIHHERNRQRHHKFIPYQEFCTNSKMRYGNFCSEHGNKMDAFCETHRIALCVLCLDEHIGCSLCTFAKEKMKQTCEGKILLRKIQTHILRKKAGLEYAQWIISANSERKKRELAEIDVKFSYFATRLREKKRQLCLMLLSDRETEDTHYRNIVDHNLKDIIRIQKFYKSQEKCLTDSSTSILDQMKINEDCSAELERLSRDQEFQFTLPFSCTLKDSSFAKKLSETLTLEFCRYSKSEVKRQAIPQSALTFSIQSFSKRLFGNWKDNVLDLVRLASKMPKLETSIDLCHSHYFFLSFPTYESTSDACCDEVVLDLEQQTAGATCSKLPEEFIPNIKKFKMAKGVLVAMVSVFGGSAVDDPTEIIRANKRVEDILTSSVSECVDEFLGPRSNLDLWTKQ